MRIVIDMATANESVPAGLSHHIAAPPQVSASSLQATTSASTYLGSTSTQHNQPQAVSRILAINPDGYYMKDLMEIDEIFKKAPAPAPMATKLSDKMTKDHQASLTMEVMLKEQIQICKGLKKQVVELRSKCEAKDQELKQVKEEFEQHNQELKARDKASRAWEKEHARRIQEWDAAQTAYKAQMTENAAWGW